MTEHATFRVSCKAILYNQDKTKVLLAEYGEGDFGLPGGHMEYDETPESAVNREISEELGIQNVQLTPSSFIKHRDGKIILFFIGSIHEETNLAIDNREMSNARWTLISDIRTHKVKVLDYQDEIVKNSI